MSFYSVMRVIFAGFVRAIHRTKVTGIENIEKGRGYLVCSNHIAFDDPIILAAVIDGDMRFMAKKEIVRTPLVGGLVRLLGAYPVDRRGRDAGAVKKTVEFLKDGKSVIMFPQGTRSGGRPPHETKVMPGCAMIAIRSEAEILPVLIETKDYRQKFLRRTYVKIGKPIKPQELAPLAAEGYGPAAEYVFAAITGMESGNEDHGS